MAGKAKIEIVDYLPEHGEYVAAHIREADAREIYYLACISPATAIRVTAAFALAAWTALVDGKPAVIFGINRQAMVSDVGVPWMLATPVMEKHRYRFLREAKHYFERMDRAFERMENHVWSGNLKSIWWLTWLGFTIEEPKPYGPFGAPFLRFGKGLS